MEPAASSLPGWFVFEEDIDFHKAEIARRAASGVTQLARKDPSGFRSLYGDCQITLRQKVGSS
jgi:hypothetical protein